jgi:hypothetical protein
MSNSKLTVRLYRGGMVRGLGNAVSDADAVAVAVADGDCVPLPVREPLGLPLPEPVTLRVAATEGEGSTDTEPDADCVPLPLQLLVAVADSEAVADDELEGLPLELGVPVTLLEGLLLRVAPALPDTVLLGDCVADEVCAEGQGATGRGTHSREVVPSLVRKPGCTGGAADTALMASRFPTRPPAAAIPR